MEEVGQHREVVAGAALGDVVDRLLGEVHDVVDVAPLPVGGAVAHGHDARARLDQTTQHRPLGHDAGVVGGVGRRRHQRDEGVQVGGAADAGQLARRGERVDHHDRVGRLAPPVEIEDGVEDGGVRGPVEVRGPQHLDDVGDRVLGEHHRAEDALLGGDVVWRCAVEGGLTRGIDALRHPHVVGKRHDTPYG